MKKYLLFIVAALMIVGCHKKPAEQQGEAQEQPVQEQQEPAESQEPKAENLYIDITGVQPNGETLSLSELVGQTDYVLLDFWASWCGPCRRFIPVLKEIYAGQPKGHFQILSCSVDRDEEPWRVALAEEQMPWPQMREDAMHPCSDKYDVQFIPHTILIDKEGCIVGINLEEPEIAEILIN